MKRGSITSFFIASLIFISILSALMINFISGMDTYGVNLTTGDTKLLSESEANWTGSVERVENLSREISKIMGAESGGPGDTESPEQSWWSNLLAPMRAVRLVVSLPGLVLSVFENIRITLNIPYWIFVPLIAGLVGVGMIILAAFILGRNE